MASKNKNRGAVDQNSENQQQPQQPIGMDQLHREQEMKKPTTVTGAGETSVPHADVGFDNDYGADGEDHANFSMEDVGGTGQDMDEDTNVPRRSESDRSESNRSEPNI